MESERENKRLEKAYLDLRPYLKKAEKQLSDIIARAASEIEDKSLVRIRVRDTRIKSFQSIQRKVRLHGFSEDDAFSKINDLVGIRIVCNNTDDVYRFYELLVKSLREDEIIGCEDFLNNPLSSGYRAFHTNIFIDVDKTFNRPRIPCEIQIRTLLQDSWAELTHMDIYKSDVSLPDDLKGRMEDLALLLSTADEIAQRVRRRISRDFNVTGTIDLNQVTREGLAYIFKQVFARSPSQYFVQKCKQQCEDSGLEALHLLEETLGNLSFREKARKAYKAATRLGFLPDAELIFSAGIKATEQDEEAGLRYIRDIARMEREDIDSTWRYEVLSQLPETIEEFLNQAAYSLKNIDWIEIAEAWDIASSCAICGTRIIDSETLCYRIADHYSQDDTAEIDTIVNGLDVEWAEGDLCSYHSYVAEKNRDD